MAAMSRGIFAVALVLLCVAAVAVHGRSNANRHAAADPTPVPRSFDGSGNNPANTEWGAAGQPFLRPYGVPDPSVPGGVRYTAYGDGKSTLARQGGPNPRAVSSGPMASKPGLAVEGRCVVAAVARVVWHSASSAWRTRVGPAHAIHRRHPRVGCTGYSTASLTSLFTYWGQFLTFDVAHTLFNASEPLPIAVPTGDPVRDAVAHSRDTARRRPADAKVAGWLDAGLAGL